MLPPLRGTAGGGGGVSLRRRLARRSEKEGRGRGMGRARPCVLGKGETEADGGDGAAGGSGWAVGMVGEGRLWGKRLQGLKAEGEGEPVLVGSEVGGAVNAEMVRDDCWLGDDMLRVNGRKW